MEVTKPKKLNIGVIIVLILFVVTGVWALQSSLSQPTNVPVSTPQVQQNTDEDAYYQAEQLIKRELKAPSTAQFPGIDQATIKRLSDNGFQVDSYVDSQNSFGAMLRSNWMVIFAFNGDLVDTYFISLDGKVLYKRDFKASAK